jgi:hypothetical protein
VGDHDDGIRHRADPRPVDAALSGHRAAPAITPARSNGALAVMGRLSGDRPAGFSERSQNPAGRTELTTPQRLFSELDHHAPKRQVTVGNVRYTLLTSSRVTVRTWVARP